MCSSDLASNTFINETHGTLIGVPAEFGYFGGGSVYQYSASKWLMFAHAENHSQGNTAIFRSSLCLLKSTDQGRSWTFLGQVLKAQISYVSPFPTIHNLDTGSHRVDTNQGVGAAGTYFYVPFQDQLANGTIVPLALARVQIGRAHV